MNIIEKSLHLPELKAPSSVKNQVMTMAKAKIYGVNIKQYPHMRLPKALKTLNISKARTQNNSPINEPVDGHSKTIHKDSTLPEITKDHLQSQEQSQHDDKI